MDKMNAFTNSEYAADIDVFVAELRTQLESSAKNNTDMLAVTPMNATRLLQELEFYRKESAFWESQTSNKERLLNMALNNKEQVRTQYRAMLEDVKAERQQLLDESDTLRQQLVALQKELEEVKTALVFYGNAENYINQSKNVNWGESISVQSLVVSDKGRKARQALGVKESGRNEVEKDV